MLQHAKAKAQISQICSGMAMIGTGPACTPNGGYLKPIWKKPRWERGYAS
jgi:hypothetical protein